MDRETARCAAYIAIILAVALLYTAIVITAVAPEEPKTVIKPVEVVVVHTYEDGYMDGYRAGKYQALMDEEGA